MPKNRCIALSAFGLVLLWASASPAAQPSTSSEEKGRIEFTEFIFDFGFIPQGAVFSHNFHARNVGRGVLNIVKVEPTCGCTTVPLNQAFLKPKETVDIRVNFDSQKFQGSINKRIKVLSTDPENGLVELFLKGVVGKPPASVELSGSALIFNEIGIVSREMHIKNLTAQEITLAVLPPVDTFLETTVSPLKIGPQSEAKLTVRLKGKPPLGEYKSSITLESTGEKVERLSIPITGTGYAR